MVDVATKEPTKVFAGDTITWKKSLSDYLPSDGWSMTYVLVNSGAKITFNTTADGDDHLVSVDTTTSAGWAAGTYRWTSFLIKDSDRYSYEYGEIEIKPDVIAGDAYDTRSTVKTILDAIEAVLAKKATKDQAAMIMPFGGRRIDRYPIEDLLKWRDKFKAEYAQEQRAERLEQGLGGRRKILTRFVNPS